jgi:major membrane immunogen (membrane-anchored lipoprotein)
MMTEMKLAIRNNARQYLEILLPAGTSNVWSAFVAGQPVRPTVRDGKLLLPLERSGADGAPVSVELTYVSTGRFPQRRGSITLDTPAVDVPLKNARWDLYLPPDYAYGSFEGSMRHEKLAAAVETAQLAATSYDWASYAKIEGANKSYRDLDQKRSLSSARSNIVGGKINDAYQYYNRAKGNMNVDDAVANEELKKLEKDIRKEQGKQLIQAQRQYRADNSGQQSAQPNAPVDVQQILMVQEDETAAAQQAEKVSKAQEIVVTKALPLRVNLPQRGQRLTFTQTLQTEVRKPMSVQFTATATKTLEWPATIGLAVTGLAGLWLLVGFVLRRK